MSIEDNKSKSKSGIFLKNIFLDILLANNFKLSSLLENIAAYYKRIVATKAGINKAGEASNLRTALKNDSYSWKTLIRAISHLDVFRMLITIELHYNRSKEPTVHYFTLDIAQGMEDGNDNITQPAPPSDNKQ